MQMRKAKNASTFTQPRRRLRSISKAKPKPRISSYDWLRKTGQVTSYTQDAALSITRSHVAMAITRRDFLTRIGQVGGYGASFTLMQTLGLLPAMGVTHETATLRKVP